MHEKKTARLFEKREIQKTSIYSSPYPIRQFNGQLISFYVNYLLQNRQTRKKNEFTFKKERKSVLIINNLKESSKTTTTTKIYFFIVYKVMINLITKKKKKRDEKSSNQNQN